MTDIPTQPSPSVPEKSGKSVGVAIAMASLLFIGTAALLYLRWATMREPTCVLIVEAPPSLRGAEVTVRGIEQPYTVTIGAGERFAIPFYLDYGSYDVRVAMNGQELYHLEANLTREQPGQRLDLSKIPAMGSAAPRGPGTSMPSTF